MNEDNLRLRIRNKILTRELPSQSAFKTWGGRATDNRCAVCDADIAGTNEIEAESADGQTRFYHVPCYNALCAERQAIGIATTVSANSAE
jgi:hypothetical protein